MTSRLFMCFVCVVFMCFVCVVFMCFVCVVSAFVCICFNEWTHKTQHMEKRNIRTKMYMKLFCGPFIFLFVFYNSYHLYTSSHPHCCVIVLLHRDREVTQVMTWFAGVCSVESLFVIVSSCDLFVSSSLFCLFILVCFVCLF